MKHAFIVVGIVFAAFIGITSKANATTYPLPEANSRLIGENTKFTVPNDGRPLEAIAADFKIGLLAMLEANPDADPYLPKPGSVLTIPTQMLLPDTPREGIVINLAELRLYYYPKGQKKVIVYPIGIGQLGRNTPTMVTSITQRIPNPTWTPTANIRKHYLEQGITLPAVVPAGPENPMGLFAMRLAAGNGEYLIHGTDANFGIGMRVSSGCIRLRPTDIEALFKMVPVGTRVQIINEPIKVSVEPDGRRYVEVHQPLSKSEEDNPQTMPINFNGQVLGFMTHEETDAKAFHQVVARRSGLPTLVTLGLAQPVAALEQPQSASAQPQQQDNTTSDSSQAVSSDAAPISTIEDNSALQ